MDFKGGDGGMGGDANLNPNMDSIVSNGPTDTVSCLRWSPLANLLLASSWSGEVRVWDIAATGQATPKLVWKHPAPVLSADWDGDQNVFSACCDGLLRMAPVTQMANGAGGALAQEIGQHAAPIKTVVWNKKIHAAITGSWDKTVRVFDPRAPTNNSTNKSVAAGGKGGEVVKWKLSGAVHGLDNRESTVVVALSDRSSVVYDLRNVASPVREFSPFLNKQSTGICLFPDRKSFALSSIEGRVRIQYLEDADSKRSFAFRCHKVGDVEAYAANGVSVSDKHGAMTTYGSDGTVVFWEKEKKQKLSAMQRMPEPITAGAFSKDGNVYAYATGYDWSKGHEHANKTKGPQIFLHPISAPEITPQTQQ